MVFKIAITPEAEAKLRRQAEAAGKDVTAYVSEIVEHTLIQMDEKSRSRGAPDTNETGAAAFDRILDEFFAQNPEEIPGLPEDFSRADIYNEHD